jgi:hypothetical protein
MTEPCKYDDDITLLRVRQAEIGGDVAHIKSRIDNGMSETISDIHDNVTHIVPIIEHHSSVIKRIEDAGWGLAYVAGGLILGVVAWAIGKGFIPKL